MLSPVLLIMGVDLLDSLSLLMSCVQVIALQLSVSVVQQAHLVRSLLR